MYLSVLEILKMVMPFVALPYLISTVGADKYGLVVFAQAIISYFIIFINFGLDVSAVKNVSINRSDNEKLSEVVSSVLIIKAFLFILSFLALGVLLLCVKQFRDNYVLFLLSFFILPFRNFVSCLVLSRGRKDEIYYFDSFYFYFLLYCYSLYFH